MKKTPKTGLNFLSATLIILVMAFIGYVLLLGVYALPTQNIRKHAYQSSLTFLREGDVYSWTSPFAGNKVDNFSPSIMMNIASFPNQNTVVNNALLNPRIEHKRSSKSAELFVATQETNPSAEAVVSYARYWNGYLIVLKPLLLIGDISTIRFLNGICQILLLLITLTLIARRLNLKQSLAFLTAVLFLNPLSTILSLQYSGTYIIMLSTMIALLLSSPQTPKGKIFLISGIMTAYIDLLSAPLITLAFPLILYTLLHKTNLKDDFKSIIKNSLAWSYGYLGMWFTKWAIASALTSENVIKDGIKNVLYRTLGNGQHETGLHNWTFLHALKSNLAVLNTDATTYIILIFLLLLCLSYFIRPYRLIKENRILLILLIGLYPFIWYAVVINHSIIHPLQAYRELTIAIYALTSALVLCLQDIHLKKDKKKI